VQPLLVTELAELLSAHSSGGDAAADAIQFVDVREESEREIAKLPHFELYPLSKWVVQGGARQVRGGV